MDRIANTGHKMDDEMFITHSEQVLEDKYQAMKHVKGWDGTKRKTIMPSSQANEIRKSPIKHLKDIVHILESMDINQQIVPTRKATKIRVKKSIMSTKRNTVLKKTLKERDIRIYRKLSALIVVNLDILHEIA